MLVGAAAAIFVMLAKHMISSFEQPEFLNVDPVRIIEAIVVGISFLGAGTILKYTRQGEQVVEGLTTSASILLVSAIGIAVALNAFVLAIGAMLLNVFINWGLMFLIGRAKSKPLDS
jgi:putative Mg2+ transporter-C (MgtC) family protein